MIVGRPNALENLPSTPRSCWACRDSVRSASLAKPAMPNTLASSACAINGAMPIMGLLSLLEHELPIFVPLCGYSYGQVGLPQPTGPKHAEAQVAPGGSRAPCVQQWINPPVDPPEQGVKP